MSKLLVICGPTATGKTSLGIRLAKKFKGEIVSADSRQAYWGMDVGTGKDLPQNAKLKIKSEKLQIKIKNGQTLKPYRFDKMPVWLLDVVEPDYRFSVADYLKCSSLVIKDIWQRGKLPILVGGTGFYIKGLIDGIGSLGVAPDWELRKQLDSLTASQLVSYLRKINPRKWEAMNESDRQNPRRLIRAIEIALKLKIKNKKLPQHQNAPDFSRGMNGVFGRSVRGFASEKREKPPALAGGGSQFSRLLMIGLSAPNRFLYQRIDKRVDERANQGVEKEIETLREGGYNWENSALGSTLGYREWEGYFREKMDNKGLLGSMRETVIQKWKFAEHAYARRQKTWFKGDARIRWFDISQKGWENKVEKLVRRWYTNDSHAKKS